MNRTDKFGLFSFTLVGRTSSWSLLREFSPGVFPPSLAIAVNIERFRGSRRVKSRFALPRSRDTQSSRGQKLIEQNSSQEFHFTRPLPRARRFDSVRRRFILPSPRTNNFPKRSPKTYREIKYHILSLTYASSQKRNLSRMLRERVIFLTEIIFFLTLSYFQCTNVLPFSFFRIVLCSC